MALDENNQIFITDEEGNEIECNILFTYHNDETNKDYVVLYKAEDAEDVESIDELSCLDIDYYSFEYRENDGQGDLYPIETEEEYDLIDDVMDQFFNGDIEVEEN